MKTPMSAESERRGRLLTGRHGPSLTNDSPLRFPQVNENSRPRNTECFGDFVDRVALLAERDRAVGLRLGRAGLAADVHSALLGGCDPHSLTLAAGLLLHLPDAKQHV